MQGCWDLLHSYADRVDHIPHRQAVEDRSTPLPIQVEWDELTPLHSLIDYTPNV